MADVAIVADRIGCHWPWRSSKVGDFHLIWKGVCHLIVTLALPISHRFRDIASYTVAWNFPLNRGQTAADGNMVTIDDL